MYDALIQQDNLIAQRRALAKSITLLESTRADHRAQADELLTRLLPHTGKALRLGISGVPGVGKSTFIESLGLFLIAQGHRVAVLAIDPSSSVSGTSNAAGAAPGVASGAARSSPPSPPSPAATSPWPCPNASWPTSLTAWNS